MGLNIYRDGDIIMKDANDEALEYLWDADEDDLRLACAVNLADDYMPDSLRQELLAAGYKADEWVTLIIQ